MTKTALTICAITVMAFFIVGASISWYDSPTFGTIVMNAGIVIGLLGTLLTLRNGAN